MRILCALATQGTILRARNAAIDVCGMPGRAVTALVNETMQAIACDATWESAGHATGSPGARVHAASLTQRVKMWLVKEEFL